MASARALILGLAGSAWGPWVNWAGGTCASGVDVGELGGGAISQRLRCPVNVV